jgi:hypothetical protein
MSGERRVLLLTGGRMPDPAAAGPHDLVLDAGGAVDPGPGITVIEARALVSAAELEDLQRRCLEVALGWHAALPSDGDDLLPPGRVIESALALELGQALKHLFLLRRLAQREGALRVVADLAHPAVARLAPVLRQGAPRIRLESPGGLHAALRGAARTLGALSRAGSGPAAPQPPMPPAPGRGRRVWGLIQYRNRPLIEALAREGRFSVRMLEPSAENRYLPPGARVAGPAGRAQSALRRIQATWDGIAAAIALTFADAPDAVEVARLVVEDLLRRLLPGADAEARAWSRLLHEDPPAAIVSGIPWSGDLRTLALVAARAGVPLLACQDGALAETGVGGVPVGAGALVWGPRGRRWFAARGFPDSALFETGDRWLDDLVDEVGRGDPHETRQRLAVPPGHRVLLVSVQNSAPHRLATDPADPVRSVRVLLQAAARTPGWTFVLKPHPRLALVDGERRLRRLRAMAAEVPAARLVDAREPIAGLMALADAHAGEGDTLALEMLACGRPAVVVAAPDLPEPYPEFTASGAMARVSTPEALGSVLGRGLAVPGEAARRLLAEHVRRAVPAADAVASAIGGGRP